MITNKLGFRPFRAPADFGTSCNGCGRPNVPESELNVLVIAENHLRICDTCQESLRMDLQIACREKRAKRAESVVHFLLHTGAIRTACGETMKSAPKMNAVMSRSNVTCAKCVRRLEQSEAR